MAGQAFCFVPIFGRGFRPGIFYGQNLQCMPSEAGGGCRVGGFLQTVIVRARACEKL